MYSEEEIGIAGQLLKGCIRLAAATNKDYQLLAHGRWFSPGTPASSTTKTSTGRHDIAEILLNVALNTKNQSINQIFSLMFVLCICFIYSMYKTDIMHRHYPLHQC